MQRDYKFYLSKVNRNKQTPQDTFDKEGGHDSYVPQA